WGEMTRATLYGLLPISIVLAVFLGLAGRAAEFRPLH
ncbi:hypothetical protein Pgy4_38151, partial [Pseudomonas savastanoi pv. glycinea str. race 4]